MSKLSINQLSTIHLVIFTILNTTKALAIS
nr:MAG TPA: hypothetical protein [Caudoviricetes sp.]